MTWSVIYIFGSVFIHCYYFIFILFSVKFDYVSKGSILTLPLTKEKFPNFQQLFSLDLLSHYLLFNFPLWILLCWLQLSKIRIENWGLSYKINHYISKFYCGMFWQIFETQRFCGLCTPPSFYVILQYIVLRPHD